ncbi:MAG: hypothetical protein J5663_03045 [Bacteroidaceae bacterium]|nr:hypothetical protein [Bacteroidaceae bacterium]
MRKSGQIMDSKYYTYYLGHSIFFFSIILYLTLVVYTPMKYLVEVEDFDYTSPLQFFNYCFLFPIVVETLVCGIILRMLMDMCNKYIAIVICALITSVMQETSFLIIPIMMISVSVYLVFSKTHSLIYAIICHVIVNFTIFLINTLPLSEWFTGVYSSLLSFSVMLGSIFYIIMYHYFLESLESET